MAVDPDFGYNDFNKSKVFSETDTKVNNLLTLLYMRPGQYPSLPFIGVDIRNYLYQMFDDIDPDVIKAKISSQCEEFIPDIEAGEIDVRKSVYKNKEYLIISLPMIIQDEIKIFNLALTTDSPTGDVISRYKIDNVVK